MDVLAFAIASMAVSLDSLEIRGTQLLSQEFEWVTIRRKRSGGGAVWGVAMP